MEGLVNDLDTEKFINAIRLQPAIWDFNHEDHGDRGAKKLAWDAVISTFVSDYDDKSSVEKKNLGNAFSRKWKSLRDCYSRELSKKRKEYQSGSTTYRKEYIYYECLKFLGTLRNNGGNEEDGDCSKDNDYDPMDPDYPEEPAPKRARRSTTAAAAAAKEGKTPNGNKNSARNQQKLQKTIDPDRAFMLSLVPEIKRIPEHLRLEVKSSLLSVFTNALSKHQRTLRNEHGNVHVYGGVPNRVTVPTVHVTVPISINYDSSAALLQPDIVANLQDSLNPTIKCDPASDLGLSDRDSELSE